jgi:hypothetical protein
MWEARPRAEWSVPRFAARAPLPQGAAPTRRSHEVPYPHVGGPPPGRMLSAKIRGEGAAPTRRRSHKPLPQSAISPCGRPAPGPNAQCQDSRRGRRSHRVPLPQGAAPTSRSHEVPYPHVGGPPPGRMLSAKIRGEGAAPTRRRSHRVPLPQAAPTKRHIPCGRPAPGPNSQRQDSRRGRRSHRVPLPQTAPTKCHIPMWEARPRAECSVPRFAARAPLPQGAAPTRRRAHLPRNGGLSLDRELCDSARFGSPSP